MLIWPLRMLGQHHRPGPARRGRRPDGSTRCSTTAPAHRRPAAARAAARRGAVAVEFSGVSLHAIRARLPGARRVRPRDRGGRVGRAGGRDRVGQDDRRQAHPALLRRRRRRGAASTACDVRDASLPASCAARSASCSRTRSCSATRSRANIAFADPDAPTSRDRAGRPARRRARVHRRAARGLRHRDRRARLLAVRAGSGSASPSPARSSPTPAC